jgi:hypothetical protein
MGVAQSRLRTFLCPCRVKMHQYHGLIRKTRLERLGCTKVSVYTFDRDVAANGKIAEKMTLSTLFSTLQMPV